MHEVPKSCALAHMFQVQITEDALKFQTLVAFKKGQTNSADPDQTASSEAV